MGKSRERWAASLLASPKSPFLRYDPPTNLARALCHSRRQKISFRMAQISIPNALLGLGPDGTRQESPERKQAFRRDGKKFLKQLADALSSPHSGQRPCADPPALASKDPLWHLISPYQKHSWPAVTTPTQTKTPPGKNHFTATARRF